MSGRYVTMAEATHSPAVFARFTGETILGEMGRLLYAIAAAVIGGTSLSGGVGTIPGAVLGALVIGLDPAPVLGNFRPEASELPFLRLSQYNGRQPATTLAEYGETGGAPLDRSAVPGTMFRLEYPQASYVSPVTGRTLLMLVIVGLLSLAAADIMARTIPLNLRGRLMGEVAARQPGGMVALRVTGEGGVQEALAHQLDVLLERLPQYRSIGVARDDGKRKGEFSAILYRAERFEPIEQGTFWLSDTPDAPGSTSISTGAGRSTRWRPASASSGRRRRSRAQRPCRRRPAGPPARR